MECWSAGVLLCLTLLVLYPAYSLRQEPAMAELQSNLGISRAKHVLSEVEGAPRSQRSD